MADALTVSGVEKRFAGVHAVRDLSFNVRRGEIFALLGPNGAGKTTLVRMLLGIIRPDSGSIAFSLDDSGDPPGPDRIGYLPEDRGLYKDIPVRRTLIFLGMLRGMSRADAGASADEWLERMALTDRAAEPVDALSKGNQQKVQFISAVLHRPALAVLDEPFSGLDPLNQDVFLGILRELVRDGMTILLSAHQMSLVEQIADRILLMSHGRMVLRGTLDELRRSVGLGTRMTFRVAGEPDLTALRAHPSVRELSPDGEGVLRLEVRPGSSLSDLLQAAGRHLDVVEVQSRPPELHDIFVRAVELSGGPTPDVPDEGGTA